MGALALCLAAVSVARLGQISPHLHCSAQPADLATLLWVIAASNA